MERLNLTHEVVVKALDEKLYLAPLDTDKVQRVLDIGTGTGVCTWQAFLNSILAVYHPGRIRGMVVLTSPS